MEQIAVIPIIQREMKSRRISASELARGLQMNPSSINGLLQRPTIQVQKLAELSAFFQYNFFREIAQKLPYAAPDYSVQPDRTETINLQNRVKELELEVSILRQTIKDLVSR